MKPGFYVLIFLAMVGYVCAGLALVAYYVGLFSSTAEFVQLLKSLVKRTRDWFVQPQEPPVIVRYWSDPESPYPPT
jgi:hypothetical protein